MSDSSDDDENDGLSNSPVFLKPTSTRVPKSLAILQKLKQQQPTNDHPASKPIDRTRDDSAIATSSHPNHRDRPVVSGDLQRAVTNYRQNLANLRSVESKLASVDKQLQQLALATHLKQELECCSSERQSRITCKVKFRYFTNAFAVSLQLRNGSPFEIAGWTLLCQLSFSDFVLQINPSSAPHLPNNLHSNRCMSLSHRLPNMLPKSSINVELLSTQKHLDIATPHSSELRLPIFVDCFLMREVRFQSTTSKGVLVRRMLMIRLCQTVIDQFSMVLNADDVFLSSGGSSSLRSKVEKLLSDAERKQYPTAPSAKRPRLLPPQSSLSSASVSSFASALAVATHRRKNKIPACAFCLSFGFSFLSLLKLSLDPQTLPTAFLSLFLSCCLSDAQVVRSNGDAAVIVKDLKFDPENLLCIKLQPLVAQKCLNVKFELKGPRAPFYKRRLYAGMITRILLFLKDLKLAENVVRLENARDIAEALTRFNVEACCVQSELLDFANDFQVDFAAKLPII